ncbi:hypothetical protein F4678DRAFT_337004 [Xylaria arbuscula]|nr:hypothetical protein F4678DRAFT_337004 [Xylaria arbuscula]
MPSFKTLLVSATLACFSAAHISLENPKPYKFVADGRLNPLSSTGSDFPCRIPPGQSYIVDGEPTPMTIGEDQTLSFSGHAVHGGGSCQLALSRGSPTKDSPWQVIHSIEGGCPARNATGNLDSEDQDKYTFQIPEGIEPGTNWTLSWVWYNRLGSQEVYMNCAPITVLPGKNKRMSLPERRDALLKRNIEFPELYLANMGDFTAGCTTADAQREMLSIAFPNPGSSVERPEGDHLFKQTCDGNPRAKKAPASGGSSGDDSGETNTSQSASSTATASSPSGSSSSSSASPLSSSKLASSAASVSSSAAAAASSSASRTSASTTDTTPTTLVTVSLIGTMTAYAAPSTSTPATSSASAATEPPSSSASPDSQGQCVEGHLTCLEDGTHFATCTGGQLTAHQPIAPGYKCTPGSGVGLEMSPM